MGQEKRGSTEQNMSAEYKAAPGEAALNQIDLDRAKASASGLQGVDQDSIAMMRALLQGGGMPGQYSGMMGGITDDMATDMAREGIRDIPAQLQTGGLLDSGVGQSIMARSAGDIRRNVAQYNVDNLSRILGMALGAPQALQAPMATSAGQLSSRLGGLRSVTQTGSSTTFGPNPFMESFQTGLGKTLGSPKFSAGPFSFGG